jgi:hypothetical protein
MAPKKKKKKSLSDDVWDDEEPEGDEWSSFDYEEGNYYTGDY